MTRTERVKIKVRPEHLESVQDRRNQGHSPPPGNKRRLRTGWVEEDPPLLLPPPPWFLQGRSTFRTVKSVSGVRPYRCFPWMSKDVV